VTSERIASHWLRAQQEVAGRAAHEVKNALNGVAVNLEVVRVLAGRNADAEKVGRFAAAAAEQLELLVRQVEALLAVVRDSAGVVDVAGVARQLVALLERSGPPGTELRLEEAAGLAAPTSADATVVRVLLARLVTGLLARPGGGILAVGLDDAGRVAATARAADGPTTGLDAVAAELATAAGVAVAAAGDGALTLYFPAASAAPTV
jgi:hypothetical protein